MKKIKPQRPSADMTRKKILQAALKLFMQHGFAGTSMGKVAEKANVNQTLIFHHFISKKQLWHQVKVMIIDSAKALPICEEPENFHQFLLQAIEQRMSIYTACPELRTLIRWQKLEPSDKKKSLSGYHHVISPLQWIEPIVFLQKQKMLSEKIKPELLVTWLIGSIDAMLDDDLGIFKNHPKNQEEYINMIVDGLLNGCVRKDTSLSV